jgi:hypothetical protein
MVVVPFESEVDVKRVNDLYSKKYLMAKLGRLLMPLASKRFAHYGAFELKPP